LYKGLDSMRDRIAAASEVAIFGNPERFERETLKIRNFETLKL